MPSTVSDVFDAASLAPRGAVRWGTDVPSTAPGIYIVALTAATDHVGGAIESAPLLPAAFDAWLDRLPGLRLDGVRPSADELMARVAAFWIADEVILYAGRATSLSARVRQYYQTPIGARGPHSGGYFLKLLANLDELWVHYAPAGAPGDAEDAVLRRFSGNVSEVSKRSLRDPAHPFPFANLEWPQGVRKAHGLLGSRERRDSKRGAQVALSGGSRLGREDEPMRAHVRGSFPTQRVTAKDLRAGRIRVPSSTKSLFPGEKVTVRLLLRGREAQCGWDPRMMPRERSGVLRVGPGLRECVREDEVLAVSTEGHVIVIS